MTSKLSDLSSKERDALLEKISSAFDKVHAGEKNLEVDRSLADWKILNASCAVPEQLEKLRDLRPGDDTVADWKILNASCAVPEQIEKLRELRVGAEGIADWKILNASCAVPEADLKKG